MTEQWEYHVAECETGRYFDAFLEFHLIPLGADGWELVHITERRGNGDTVSLKGYFKRRKPQ